MLFNWNSALHGRCLVSALSNAEMISVIFTWGEIQDDLSVEYRIKSDSNQGEKQQVEFAARIAMAHFDNCKQTENGLMNLAVDASSKFFTGEFPAPLN